MRPPIVRGSPEELAEAKARGYEGERCSNCGNMTLVRNGTHIKCNFCGNETGGHKKRRSE